MSREGETEVLTLPVREIIRLGEAGRLRTGPHTRPEAWGQHEIVSFLDSLYRGYPTGQLLFLRGAAPADQVELGGTTIRVSAAQDAWTIIDGYQRVSILMGAWRADAGSPYFVCFDLQRRTFRAGMPQHPGMLPLPVAVDAERLRLWLQRREHLPEGEKAEALGLADRLQDRNMSVSVVEGPAENVADIFARINTGGRQLTRDDLDRARTALFRTPTHRSKGRSLAHYSKTNLGFGYFSRELGRQCSALGGSTYAAARDAFSTAVAFLQHEARIPHVRLMPDEWMLPVVVRFFGLFGSSDRQANELLRRWLWRADTSSLQDALADVGTTALEEAERLLARSASTLQPYQPDPTQTHLDTTTRRDGEPDLRTAITDGRMNALGLLGTVPLVVVPTHDVPEQPGSSLTGPRTLLAWLDSGADAFVPLTPRPPESFRPLGAHLFHPSVPRHHLLDALLALPPGDPILKSHVIDEECSALLHEQRFEAFTERRTGLLTTVIARRVQSFARVGFRDRRTLPTLALPAEDEDE